MRDVGYRAFLALFVVFCGVFLFIGAAGLKGLEAIDRLPPPPFTVTDCIDEKFAFLREKNPKEADLIAVGSSVTWRNLDFSAVGRAETGATHPLNAAPCFLHVHETRFLTNFYLDHMPKVKTVVSIFAMRDFEACAGDGAFFPETLVRLFLFENWPGLPVYFINFRPRPFLGSVRKIKEMRSGELDRAPLVMDAYGSGPLEGPPVPWQDVQVDQACLDNLARMEAELAARGVRWIVVMFPPMPMWLESFDPDGSRDRAWRRQVETTLVSSNTVLIDGAEAGLTDVNSFADPAHLNWPQVPRFTRWIFQQADGQTPVRAAQG
ncbi:hypothetical protein [Chthonobacter rhizosphaerae]|uniref:hypothetical protein n=1 Tax=Chthonobacter rhizosphaerae TaxID=2735553 RepID=UPI0015EF022B|nr:hypothetical protein [Chthonobacter rhizosphaerae]